MEWKIGLEGRQKVVVTKEMTAKMVGSGTLPVLATPKMIALMENTAYQSIEPYLEKGQTTVGTYIGVKHLAATSIGKEIEIVSKLKMADRKRLVFELFAFDAAGCIGEGEHERFLVEEEKFLKKAEDRVTHG